MKRLVILMLSILLSFPAFSQTVVTNPIPYLTLTLRSVQTLQTDVELTFLITNTSPSELPVSLIGGFYQDGTAGTVAYDSEGNIYQYHDILVSIGNNSYNDQTSLASFPSNVPVKCHLLIRNVDPEATFMSKIKLCVLSDALDIRTSGICFHIDNVNFRN